MLSALDRPQSGCFSSDPIVAAYRKLLLTEKNKDVRIAVVQSLPLTADTVGDIIARTADVTADVRRAALGCLQAVPIKVCQATYALKPLTFLI